MGQIKISPDMTFRSLSKLWFKEIKESKSNASKKRIKYKIDFANEYLGEISISKLTKDDIEYYFKKVSNKTYTSGYCLAKKNIRQTLYRHNFTSNRNIHNTINMHYSQIGMSLAGNKTSIKWAKKFASKLKIPYEELFDEFSKEINYSDDECSQYRTVVRKILNFGCELGVLDKNVASVKNIGKLKYKPKKVIKPANKEELNKLFICALNHDNKKVMATVILSIVANFHRNKIVGLQWDNIDFGNNIINFKNETYLYDNKIKQKEIDETVKVNEILMSVIKEYKNYILKNYGNTKYVFPKENGEMCNPSSLKKWFKVALQDVGIDYLKNINFKKAEFNLEDLNLECAGFINPSIGKEILDNRENEVKIYNTSLREEMNKYGFKTYSEYFDFIKFVEAVSKKKKENEMM